MTNSTDKDLDCPICKEAKPIIKEMVEFVKMFDQDVVHAPQVWDILKRIPNEWKE